MTSLLFNSYITAKILVTMAKNLARNCGKFSGKILHQNFSHYRTIFSSYIKAINPKQSNMSAMIASKFDQPSPPKRAKTTAGQNPSGIGIAIRSKDVLALSRGAAAPGTPNIWVGTGDRTRDAPLPGSNKTIKQKHAEEFWQQPPHNILLVPLDPEGNKEPLHVPGCAMKNGEPFVFSDREQGDAMVAACLSKKWVPKCVWPEQAEADAVFARLDTCIELDEAGKPKLDRKGLPKADKKALKAMAQKIVGELPEGRAEFFLSLCADYTKLVFEGDNDGRPFLVDEIVRGGIKKGSDAGRTALEEGFEESGVPMDFLEEHLRPTGPVEYISPDSGRKKLNETYELLIERGQMEAFWGAESARRRQMTNWFCPIGYYQYLPGIDVNGMEDVKGLCEIRDGRWLSQAEAEAILDAASLNILGHVLKH